MANPTIIPNSLTVATNKLGGEMGKIWQQGNKADLCLGENLVYVPVIAVEQTTPKTWYHNNHLFSLRIL